MLTRQVASVPVTEIGFGCASLGNLYRPVTDDIARDALAAAWDGGIRYFDTAPHYGLGLSERRLGAALAERERAEFTISTKVGRLLEPNPAPTGSDLAVGGFAVPDDLRRRFDFSADGVRRSLDASLTRLGLDRVDIVYVHDPDDHLDQAVAEAVPALVALREQGVLGAVGVGINQWPAAVRLVTECDLDVVMLAGRWTLLDRSGAPLLAACAERGVAVVAAAPYNSGLLAADRPPADAHYQYDTASPEVLAQANRLADVCERHGVRLPAAAIQFALRSPVVRSVVVGLASPAHVAATLARLVQPIDEPTWAELAAPRG